MKKKNIILLSCCSALTTISAVVPLVVSCSNEKVHDIGNFDKTFNVDDIMYKKLEKKIRSVYSSSLHDKKPDEVKRAMAELENDLTTFREKQNSEKLSYTLTTNSMLKYFGNKHSVLANIQRDFSEHPINWTQKVNDFNAELKNQLKSRLIHDGMSSSAIEINLKKFNSQFSDLCGEIDKKYADPLLKLTELKSQSLSCFGDINEYFSFLAAKTKLKNFFDDYHFDIDRNFTNPNNSQSPIYWDELQKELPSNGDITDFVQNNCCMTNNRTKTQTKDFSLDNLIGGYHVAPFLKGWEEDIEKNQYKMLIDWQLISNSNYALSLKNPEIRIKTTAHSAVLKNNKNHPELLESGENYAKDFYSVPDNEKTFTNLYLPCSPTHEMTNIRTAYLNHLKFDWDRTDDSPTDPLPKCAYENFFNFFSTDDESIDPTEGYQNQNSLAAAGLTIKEIKKNGEEEKPIRVSEILNKIENYKKTSSEELPNTLPYKFFQNCALESYTRIVSDEAHSVSCTLYAGYLSNSHLSPVTPGEPGCRKAMITDNLNSEGMPISKKLFDDSLKVFKPIKNWVDDIKDLKLWAKILNECDKAQQAIEILSSILTVQIAIEVALLIFTKTPSTVAMWVVLVSCLSATIGFEVGFDLWKKNKVGKMHQQNFDLVQTSLWTDIQNSVYQDHNELYCDYNIFKKHPYLTIRGKNQYYSHFQHTQLYKKLLDKSCYKDIDYTAIEILEEQFIALMISAGVIYAVALVGLIYVLKVKHDLSTAAIKPLEPTIESIKANFDGFSSELLPGMLKEAKDTCNFGIKHIVNYVVK